MTNFTLKLLASAFLITTALYAEPSENSEPVENQVIPLDEMTPSGLSDVTKGHLPHIFVLCDTGIELAVNVFTSGEFLSSENPYFEAPLVRIEKPFYFRHDGNELLFSSDASDWKNFSDFFTGSLNFGVEIKDCRPVLRFDIDLNER